MALAASVEYSVKAAYLYNFARYLTWPEGSFASETSPYSLCILGGGPLVEVLRSSVSNKTVKERGFAVQSLPAGASVKRLRSCHALFISSAHTGLAAAVVQGLGTAPVVVVGESPRMLGAGAAFNFIPRGTKLGVELKREVLTRRGISASSRLLQVVELID
jgi:hypothetical protein